MNNKLTGVEHNLKIAPEYFAAVVAGVKHAEMRFNDRNYQTGDVLNLCEWDDGTFTGDFVSVDVTHVCELPSVPGYALLSFELQERRKAYSQPVSNRDELREKVPSTQPAADLYALCWESGDVVAYTPDSEKAAIWLNNYSGTRVQEYVTLEQFQGVVSGNSPVTPDGWIKCSDRTPKTGQAVIGCVDFDSNIVTPLVREFIWTGSTFRRGVSSTGVKSNDSIVVTHWMPLPAAPKKD